MKKNDIFISCDQAKEICDKLQYNEATWLEKLKFKFRYLYCHVTRNYSNKNDKLTSTCNKAQIQCMDLKEKEELKKSLESHLRNK